MATVALVGEIKPSIYSRHLIAKSMFNRGVSFFGSSFLLDRNGGNGYVVLYLLCQSIELILKSLMILSDYNNYINKLNAYGHNLVRSENTVEKIYNQNPIRKNILDELTLLNDLYNKPMRLRYASFFDIFIDPKTIKRDLVFRRIAALIRLVHRELAKNETTKAAAFVSLP